jgi:hypothetical protein
MDTFCPVYEENPSSLSDKARVQILRAIGVAIVKHGSMFPTMELLLRHAINYLDMSKHKAITQGGIIDDEEGLFEDFDKISLDESRAVLCTHMLCYVLDGSIGMAEANLWTSLLSRVEECYQVERAKLDDLSLEQLRAFIVQKSPRMASAVARIPETGKYLNDLGRTEMQELQELMTYLDVRPPILPSFLPFCHTHDLLETACLRLFSAHPNRWSLTALPSYAVRIAHRCRRRQRRRQRSRQSSSASSSVATSPSPLRCFNPASTRKSTR